jgi:hypothetical protein
MEAPEAPPNSPFVSASPISVATSVSSDAHLIASLQEELNVSRQFQTNLSKQCELLREQVHFLELQLSRRDAEITRFKSEKPTTTLPASSIPLRSTHSASMEVDEKPETIQSVFHPQHVHPPPAKHSEEMRDSIEEALSEDGKTKTASTDAIANSKKRGREYQAIDKPGLIKRLSFEMSETAHPHPQHSSSGATFGSNTNSTQMSSIPAQQGPPPQLLCDIDSQALMDAMDQFEASNVAARPMPAQIQTFQQTNAGSVNMDSTTSTSISEQNASTTSNSTLPGPRRSTPSPSPPNSQISTSNSETNGSKPPSPRRPSLPVSLQTQNEEPHSPFMLTSAQ